MDDVHEIREKLRQVYEEWRFKARSSEQDFAKFSPPLLIDPTEEYLRSRIRILVVGQETLGWSWNSSLKECYPRYPEEWTRPGMNSFNDFLREEDAVSTMQYAYKLFNFSEYQRRNYCAPFFSAFREIMRLEGSGLLYTNISKTAYDDTSIFHAPKELRNPFLQFQENILAREIAILKPDACIFFTGPHYHSILNNIFPSLIYEVGHSSIEHKWYFSKLRHSALPEISIRTYHPGYLIRSEERWKYIDLIMSIISEHNIV